MSILNEKRNKTVAIIVSIVAAVLVVFVGFCAVYVNDYYRADMDAIVEFNAGTD